MGATFADKVETQWTGLGNQGLSITLGRKIVPPPSGT